MEKKKLNHICAGTKMKRRRMRRLIKHFLNTKAQRHKVAIAEGKISRSKYRRRLISQSYYRQRLISQSKYHEATIAEGINIVYPTKTL